MTETAAPTASDDIITEPSHHPYCRPKDAATLILIDRSSAAPRVLVGRRHDNVVFMPGQFVFPGGRVDKTDHRVPVAAPISAELQANLLKGSPKTTATRARALGAVCLRRPAAGPVRAVSDRPRHHPARPDQAVRHPILQRRRSAIAHRIDGVVHAEAELVELAWVEIGSQPLAAMHPMTKKVLAELKNRLSAGPLRHDAPVPFFHFYGGRMQMDLLPGG